MSDVTNANQNPTCDGCREQRERFIDAFRKFLTALESKFGGIDAGSGEGWCPTSYGAQVAWHGVMNALRAMDANKPPPQRPVGDVGFRALEERLAHRAATNRTNARLAPDLMTTARCEARAAAYETALGDVRETRSEVQAAFAKALPPPNEPYTCPECGHEFPPVAK